MNYSAANPDYDRTVAKINGDRQESCHALKRRKSLAASNAKLDSLQYNLPRTSL
jgi:hypothetical protein